MSGAPPNFAVNVAVPVQIIVESKPPQPDPETGTPVATPSDAQPWGVYGGSDIFRLVAWLRAGTLASEEPLRRALEQAPIPLPPADTVIIPGKWQVRRYVFCQPVV